MLNSLVVIWRYSLENTVIMAVITVRDPVRMMCQLPRSCVHVCTKWTMETVRWRWRTMQGLVSQQVSVPVVQRKPVKMPVPTASRFSSTPLMLQSDLVSRTSTIVVCQMIIGSKNE